MVKRRSLRANPKVKTEPTQEVDAPVPTEAELNDNIPACLAVEPTLAEKVDKALAEMSSDITPKHRVSLLRDHSLAYPYLGLEVFVSGPAVEERQFAEMLARSHCTRAKSILEADLVIFVGGADVEPAYYGETDVHPSTHFYDERDNEDVALYVMCLENGIPMLGVCRGAQFLHVMNGGKLYQDINNHYGDHPIWDVNRKIRVEQISSVHHQMCIANKEMEIIATSCTGSNGRGMATERWRNSKDCDKGTRADVEAFFYRETCCIGVQGHPEYSGYNFYTKWVLELLDELVINNLDVDWVGGNRRIKPDLLAQRQGKIIIPQTDKEK